MATENDIDLDSIIDRLLEVRGSRPGKQVQLLEQEIRFLCTKTREIFISQPILLELEAPIKVCNPPAYPMRNFLAVWRQILLPFPSPPDLRRHSRPILRSSAPLRIRRL